MPLPMQILRISFLAAGAILICPALASAQKTMVEKFNPTTPENDAKENSADVPEVYTVAADIRRTVILRFKYKTDLLAGIQQAIKANNIRNAVILSGIGSVRNYHIHQVSNRTFPSKNAYVKDPTAPADLVSVNGYIIGGKVHAHLTLATPGGAFAGHLEPGTNVFTFAILTLGVLDEGLDLSTLDDKTYR
jgi:predicted DNA-binding protein with PD1-like motif